MGKFLGKAHKVWGWILKKPNELDSEQWRCRTKYSMQKKHWVKSIPCLCPLPHHPCNSIHSTPISENLYFSEHPVHSRLYHIAHNSSVCCLNHSVLLVHKFLLSPETHGSHLECRNHTMSIFGKLHKDIHRTGHASNQAYCLRTCWLA